MPGRRAADWQAGAAIERRDAERRAVAGVGLAGGLGPRGRAARRAAPGPGKLGVSGASNSQPKFRDNLQFTSVIAPGKALHRDQGALDRPCLGDRWSASCWRRCSPKRHRMWVNLNPLVSPANLASKGGLLWHWIHCATLALATPFLPRNLAGRPISKASRSASLGISTGPHHAGQQTTLLRTRRFYSAPPPPLAGGSRLR